MDDWCYVSDGNTVSGAIDRRSDHSCNGSCECDGRHIMCRIRCDDRVRGDGRYSYMSSVVGDVEMGSIGAQSERPSLSSCHDGHEDHE